LHARGLIREQDARYANSCKTAKVQSSCTYVRWPRPSSSSLGWRSTSAGKRSLACCKIVHAVEYSQFAIKWVGEKIVHAVDYSLVGSKRSLAAWKIVHAVEYLLVPGLC
jgi:hypothetical protein